MTGPTLKDVNIKDYGVRDLPEWERVVLAIDAERLAADRRWLIAQLDEAVWLLRDMEAHSKELDRINEERS
jgi:hypothetical protein